MNYDAIGAGYARRRRTDPRVASHIERALGDARTVVNVGAGTGSYEPAGRRVTAVEPSVVMIDQRPSGAAPAIRAAAEDLPFDDGAFDAAMAVLTVHHWRDRQRGLAEMRRVARRVVLLTWDPAHPGFWLTQSYFPDLLQLDRERFPPLAALAAAAAADRVDIRVVPVPADCTDGFLGAYWRRPEAYLDDDVRGGMSTFGRIRDVPWRLTRLADDLRSGRWRECHGNLLEREELDLGYRLIVSGAG